MGFIKSLLDKKRNSIKINARKKPLKPKKYCDYDDVEYERTGDVKHMYDDIDE